jgi:prepilin-type N-terminal cleavage/methylation domain-containing protein
MRRSARDPEAGFSLPEVMITIVIVGVAFAAILGGMMTSITVSDLHRKEATADTLLRSAAEAVQDRQVSYVPCAGSSAYGSALPAGVSLTAVAYGGWTTEPTPPSPAKSFSSSCGSNDAGVQLITVSASSTGETLQFVKRDRRGEPT